jgi:fatty acid desaturase
MKTLFRYTSKDAWLFIQPVMIFVSTLAMAIVDPAFYWWLVVGVAQWWLAVNVLNSSLHHHAHWTTFVNGTYNRIYELFLSVVTGKQFHSWKIAHVKHHVHINDRPVDGKTKDPVSVYACGKNGERELFWSFIFNKANWQLKALFVQKQLVSLTKFDKWFKQETFAVRLWFISLFVINPLYGLFIFALNYVVTLGDAATSYGEHWGVLERRGDTTQDSIGIYSKWYNIIGFNAGYHQEHHHQPSLHWSRLPEITKDMHPNRKIVGGMHILNNPFWQDLKLTFKPSSSSSTEKSSL